MEEKTQQALAELESRANAVYLAEMEEHRGKQLATFEEHPDGTATVRIMGGPLFTRDKHGRVTYSEPGLPPSPYGLFVNNNRFWRHVRSSYAAHIDWLFSRIAAELLKTDEAERDDPFSPTMSEEAKARWTHKNAVQTAAAAHAQRIHRSIINMYSPQQRSKHLAKQTYKLYDPKLFSLLVRTAKPHNRNSTYYNHLTTIENPEDLNPSVLALYLHIAKKTNPALDPIDHVKITQAVRHSLNGPGGLSRSAWRYILNLKPSITSRIDVLDLIWMLASTGETPRLTTYQYLQRAWRRVSQLTTIGTRPNQRFTQYARAVMRATEKKRGIRAFLNNLEDNPASITDWLATNPEITNAQAALPLTWWQRQAELWHADPTHQAATLSMRKANRERQSALQAHLRPLTRKHKQEEAELTATLTSFPFSITSAIINGVSITALTTPEALDAEGERMEHCSAQYTTISQRGANRLFHLKSSSEETTLELEYAGYSKKWFVQQHAGVDNAAPGTTHEQAASAFAREYTLKQPTAHDDPLGELQKKHAQEILKHIRAYNLAIERGEEPIPYEAPHPEQLTIGKALIGTASPF